MGLQLIFCMETTAKNKSDQMYIWSTIDHFYQVDQANVGGDESSHYLRLPVGTRSENARVRAGNQNTLDTSGNHGKLYYRFNDKPDIVGYND